MGTWKAPTSSLSTGALLHSEMRPKLICGEWMFSSATRALWPPELASCPRIPLAVRRVQCRRLTSLKTHTDTYRRPRLRLAVVVVAVAVVVVVLVVVVVAVAVMAA